MAQTTYEFALTHIHLSSSVDIRSHFLRASLSQQSDSPISQTRSLSHPHPCMCGPKNLSMVTRTPLQIYLLSFGMRANIKSASQYCIIIFSLQ